MARLNLDDDLKDDPRYQRLEKLVGRQLAVGVWRDAAKLAQKHWKRNRSLMPFDVFEMIDNFEALLESRVCERREHGVYLRGSEEFFDWLVKRVEAGRDGGEASGESRRRDYDDLERSKPEQSEANVFETNPHPPSLSHSHRKPGSKSSAADPGRGANPIYQTAGELREGLGNAKIAEWYTLYPDPRFLEDELAVVWQYWADRPTERPRARGAWVKAVGYHFKQAWEKRSNLRARDALLTHVMNGPPSSGAGSKAVDVHAIIAGDPPHHTEGTG